jgi:hypothetical protein
MKMVVAGVAWPMYARRVGVKTVVADVVCVHVLRAVCSCSVNDAREEGECEDGCGRRGVSCTREEGGYDDFEKHACK